MISNGPDAIKDFKKAVRERIAKDHYIDIAGTDADHGEHARVTFHEPLASHPAPGADKGALYTKDVSGKAELHWVDEDGISLQLTSAGAIDYSSNAFVPAGAVIPFMGTSAPNGFLECNGSARSRTTYSDLFSIISTMYGAGDGSTTFNLPDLRGYFLRGYDHGAGNDPDAASRTDRGDSATGDNVGTKQADEHKAHTHDIEHSSDRSGSGPNCLMKWTVTGQTTTSTTTGGNETRPKNISTMYCIKT